MSGTKLRFRVNATRRTPAESQKNYGFLSDFVGSAGTKDVLLETGECRDACGATHPRIFIEVIANRPSL
jgi:hypothetical protein